MERRMRDSDIEWIGKMPEHWETKKLKYLFTIKKQIAGKDGYDILAVTQNGIKIKDISNNEGQISQDYSKYQLVKIGDFVMNHMDLLTGFVDCSKYEGVTSPDYRVFILNNTALNSKKFYTYLFQTCYKTKIFYGLGQGVSGLGRWRLQTDKFLNFELPVPSLSEQRVIADFLDCKRGLIDSIIEKQKVVIEKLKLCKQSIITEAVTKGLDPTVKMKQSGIEWIGEIPESWEVYRIKNIVNFNPRYSEALEDGTGVSFSPMEYIGQGNMSSVASTIEKVRNGYTYFANRDIVMAKVTPCFENGNIAIADNLISGVGFGSSELYVFRCTRVNDVFLFYFLQNVTFKKRCISSMYGTGGLKRVSLDFVNMYKLALPPISEQQAISDYLDIKCTGIDRIINGKQKLIDKLTDYKKSLIYECVTGRREVV